VKYTELDSDTKKNLFRDFKINYNKAYKDSKEESFRMQQFDSFLERVDKINAMQIATGGEGVVHGVTKFADYTQDEFAKMFMGFVPADAETKKTRMEKQKAITVHPTSSSKTSVDWTGVYTTSVNDQDRCASSWAWSASQQIESDAIRLGLIPLSDAFKLSPQQILDCDAADAGCDGGNTHTAFETVFKVLNPLLFLISLLSFYVDPSCPSLCLCRVPGRWLALPVGVPVRHDVGPCPPKRRLREPRVVQGLDAVQGRGLHVAVRADQHQARQDRPGCTLSAHHVWPCHAPSRVFDRLLFCVRRRRRWR